MPKIMLDGLATLLLAEHTAAVDPSRLGEHAGHLTFDEMRQLDAAVRVVLDL